MGSGTAVRTMWFRGSAAYDKSLVPALYRHKNPPDGSYTRLEKKLSAFFLQRGAPFRPREINGEWESSFYMQHYGFPTRLLDWSESPLVALYFALTDNCAEAFPGKDFTSVWVLDPVAWNKTSLEKEDIGILDLSSSFAQAYVLVDGNIYRSEPAAMTGTHNSVRIASQRGVFVVFGNQTTPMEQIVTNDKYKDETLHRIDIPNTHRKPLLETLLSFGVTPSTLFQDLPSLALEVKQAYGF